MNDTTAEEPRPIEIEIEVAGADGEPGAPGDRPPAWDGPAAGAPAADGPAPGSVPSHDQPADWLEPADLALYRRPADDDTGPEPPSYPGPHDAASAYADPVHAGPEHAGPEHAGPEHEAGYPDTAVDADPRYPAAELATAEYPRLEPPAAGQDGDGRLDAMFEAGDAALDGGRRIPRAALAVTGAALVLAGFGGLVLTVASHVTAPAEAGTARVPAAARSGPSGAAPRAAGEAPPAPGDAPPPADAGQAGAVVTAARDGRTSASFELASDASSVDVRVGDLGADLYRVTTPAGSPVRPNATADGDGVRLELARTGPGTGPTQVGIVLNSQVRWALRIAGGVQTGTLDLRGGTIGGVELAGGAGRFDLSLPRPKGTLSVRMSGGVNVFQLQTEGKVPVRVTARSGAGQILLDGTTTNGVARGASFRSPGWSAQTDRIDLDAVAGFGTLRVSRD